MKNEIIVIVLLCILFFVYIFTLKATDENVRNIGYILTFILGFNIGKYFRKVIK
jgi:hypothetical protein